LTDNDMEGEKGPHRPSLEKKKGGGVWYAQPFEDFFDYSCDWRKKKRGPTSMRESEEKKERRGKERDSPLMSVGPFCGPERKGATLYPRRKGKETKGLELCHLPIWVVGKEGHDITGGKKKKLGMSP